MPPVGLQSVAFVVLVGVVALPQFVVVALVVPLVLYLLFEDFVVDLP